LCYCALFICIAARSSSTVSSFGTEAAEQAVPQASGVGEGINMEMEVQEILHLICYAPTKVFVPEGMPIVHAQYRLHLLVFCTALW